MMSSFTNPLDNIKVASPCSADWEGMIGNNRQRYCGQCELNVYNLSGMTRREAENLLLQSEGRLCVRFYRRADGTILTKDCPVGWQAVKKRMSRYWTAAFSLIFGLFTGLGINAFYSMTQEAVIMGGIPAEREFPEPDPTPVEDEEMGTMTMGDVAIEPRDLKGKVSNFDEVKREVLRNQEK
ncbi:MAG: hypothetical protein R2747_00845 [Pyrinomonadaceae bacterium]